MPSKKRSRAAQIQPQPAPSDYDTDNAAFTDANAQGQPANVAPPAPRTNTELNLTVLHRYCPDIQSIVTIAPFAVVYLFSPETQLWEKCGIEGTLFVCSLTSGRYNVVMLNRKSLDNFITELHSAEDVEITDEYVILQVIGEDGRPQIYGLWIFSDNDEKPTTRETVAYAIQECSLKAEQAAAQTQNGQDSHPYGLDGTTDSHEEPEAAPAQPNSAAGRQIDLLQLFGKPNTHFDAQAHHIDQGQQAQPATRHQSNQQPTESSFIPEADNYRFSQGPDTAQQPNAPPLNQQNALLDLFKNAKRG